MSQPFRAVLTPHRSLPREGFIALMLGFGAVNFAAGLFFFVAGAWPVAGFMGLDVLLLWLAFRLNYASGRASEIVEVAERELVLTRRLPGRAQRVERFERPWVRVELDEDRERDLIGALYVVARGKRSEVGGFLSPLERKSLAAAIAAALTVEFTAP